MLTRIALVAFLASPSAFAGEVRPYTDSPSYSIIGIDLSGFADDCGTRGTCKVPDAGERVREFGRGWNSDDFTAHAKRLKAWEKEQAKREKARAKAEKKRK